MFQGSGGSSTTNNSQSTSSTDYSPQYDSYVNNILSTAQGLGNTPFPSYDVNSMFAPFQPAQQQAFGQVQNGQTAYQPYIGSATGALNNVAGYNPVAAASPYFQQASATPNPYQAGAGYLSQAAQGWNNPSVQSSYMNPYLSGALGYSTQLAQQNLMENTLPQINDQFVKSGGGLGGDRNQEFLGRATRDFNNAQIGQYDTAASNQYNQNAQQFDTDQSRLASVGTGLGGLSSSALSNLGTLGTQAAGVLSGAVNAGTGLANAYSNLGGALSNLNLTNSNALLQVGNQQQQQVQNPLTANYNQFQQAAQWPFQLVNFMNQAQSGLKIPSTTDTTSSSTQTGSQNSSPSILGGILGTASSLFGIPGVSNFASNLFSGLGGLGGSAGAAAATNPIPDIAAAALVSRGGYIDGHARGGAIRRYAEGGRVARRRHDPTLRYAIGGSVPITKGIMSNFAPAQRALMGAQGRPPQMGPAMAPGLPPIPPPMMAGALRGMGA